MKRPQELDLLSSEYIDRLIRQLEHPDTARKRGAVELLSFASLRSESCRKTLESPRNVSLLHVCLKDKNPTLRLSAARILKRLESDQADAAVQAHCEQIRIDERRDVFRTRASLVTMCIIMGIPSFLVLQVIDPQTYVYHDVLSQVQGFFDVIQNGLGLLLIVGGIMMSLLAAYRRYYWLLILSVMLVAEIVYLLSLLERGILQRFISSL